MNTKKDIRVSLLLSESTTSLLSLKSPYLEELHSDKSYICITASETDYSKNLQCSFSKDYKESKSLQSQIGYFYGNSSGSVFEYSSDDINKKKCMANEQRSSTYVLKPLKIHTRPLVTIRSLAHGDKLDIKLKTIYVSLLSSKTSLASDYICRICHGGESIGDLLTPCRCRGTLALVHLSCLETWLLQSARSYCELCQHRYEIIRQPKYRFPLSVLMYLIYPGTSWKDVLYDFIAFVTYTPCAIAATYMLMILCDSIHKPGTERSISTHFAAACAIFGIATVDFTYTTWLLVCLQKHYEAWVYWSRNNSSLKIILPTTKRRSRKRKDKKI